MAFRNSLRIHSQNNLALGYDICMSEVRNAASALGRRSAQARIKKWGRREFVKRMREWGKLGGRPRSSGKKGGTK